MAAAAVRVMRNRISHPDDRPMKVVFTGKLVVRESSTVK
jgi:DNA-binding LacI/PurR family transcriptional regulator